MGEASPLRTIWTASKRRRLKRRSTALRAQTYAGRATATAASVARIVSHCDEGRTIGMLRVVTTTTRPKTAITAAELSAYAAESLTTRSTSYRRYLTTDSAAPSTRVMMHGVRIQPAAVVMTGVRDGERRDDARARAGRRRRPATAAADGPHRASHGRPPRGRQTEASRHSPSRMMAAAVTAPIGPASPSTAHGLTRPSAASIGGGPEQGAELEGRCRDDGGGREDPREARARPGGRGELEAEREEQEPPHEAAVGQDREHGASVRPRSAKPLQAIDGAEAEERPAGALVEGMPGQEHPDSPAGQDRHDIRDASEAPIGAGELPMVSAGATGQATALAAVRPTDSDPIWSSWQEIRPAYSGPALTRRPGAARSCQAVAQPTLEGPAPQPSRSS